MSPAAREYIAIAKASKSALRLNMAAARTVKSVDEYAYRRRRFYALLMTHRRALELARGALNGARA